jgi:hypothetical protein
MHLKLEKPRLRFLEGSGGASPAPVDATAVILRQAAPHPPPGSALRRLPRPLVMRAACVPTYQRWFASAHSSPRPKTSSLALAEGRGPAAPAADGPRCTCGGAPTS